MSILGNRVLRKEDPKFLTGGGTYVDDLRLEGAAHLTYVRSTVAHARIASIDVDAARAAPGVVAVLTGADVDLAVAAAWSDDGRLTHWASSQAPHTLKGNLARYLALEPEQIRVIAPDVGGGFGSKAVVYPDEMLVGWLAKRVGRPLRWVETRSESMVNMAHGRAQIQDVEIGGSRDGTIKAYRLTALQDGGAY